MTQSGFLPAFDALPPSIPVFPLTGVLLLPRGTLPLNIFEPRYLAMVDDALAAPDRMIGITQPLTPNDNGAAPDIYPTICGGRITGFEETPDGRYLITLTGVCRCQALAELTTIRGYRRFQVDWANFSEDYDRPGDMGLDRDRLMPALERFFHAQGITANWDSIRDAPDERLVTSLAMICPFEPSEKQALLEAESPQVRAELLVSLIEMAAMVGDGPEGARH